MLLKVLKRHPCPKWPSLREVSQFVGLKPGNWSMAGGMNTWIQYCLKGLQCTAYLRRLRTLFCYLEFMQIKQATGRITLMPGVVFSRYLCLWDISWFLHRFPRERLTPSGLQEDRQPECQNMKSTFPMCIHEFKNPSEHFKLEYNT